MYVCGLSIGGIALYGFHMTHLSDFFVILVFGVTIFNYNVIILTCMLLDRRLQSQKLWEINFLY